MPNARSHRVAASANSTYRRKFHNRNDMDLLVAPVSAEPLVIDERICLSSGRGWQIRLRERLAANWHASAPSARSAAPPADGAIQRPAAPARRGIAEVSEPESTPAHAGTVACGLRSGDDNFVLDHLQAINVAGTSVTMCPGRKVCRDEGQVRKAAIGGERR